MTITTLLPLQIITHLLMSIFQIKFQPIQIKHQIHQQYQHQIKIKIFYMIEIQLIQILKPSIPLQLIQILKSPI